MLHDLNLKDDRFLLKQIIERTIPKTFDDIVIIMVSAIGYENGELVEKLYSRKIVGNNEYTAIQLTTAGSVCAVFDMLANNHIKKKGLVLQEELNFIQFRHSSFLATSKHNFVY